MEDRELSCLRASRRDSGGAPPAGSAPMPSPATSGRGGRGEGGGGSAPTLKIKSSKGIRGGDGEESNGRIVRFNPAEMPASYSAFYST